MEVKTTITLALLLVSTFSFAQTKRPKFVLNKPDMVKIKRLQTDKSYAPLYAYLVCNYDTIGTQKFLGGKCDFSQEFKSGISYVQKECSVGVSAYQLTIPLIEISAIKKMFAVLFQSEGYVWSRDSLSYTSKSGAGGTFEYKKMKHKVICNIFFTD